MKKEIDDRYAVYKHYHNNILFYIGCGSMSYNRPYNSNSRNNNWWKFCDGNFDVEIVKFFNKEDKKEAEKLEAELIEKEKEINPNLVNIGIGKSYIGKNNGMYNKGYLLKGRKFSEEHKEKLRISNIGKQSRNKNPMYGVSMFDRLGKDVDKYEKWKKNIGNSKKGKLNHRSVDIFIYDKIKKETFIVNTINDASEITNIPASSISYYTRKNDLINRNNFFITRKEDVFNELVQCSQS